MPPRSHVVIPAVLWNTRRPSLPGWFLLLFQNLISSSNNPLLTLTASWVRHFCFCAYPYHSDYGELLIALLTIMIISVWLRHGNQLLSSYYQALY